MSSQTAPGPAPPSPVASNQNLLTAGTDSMGSMYSYSGKGKGAYVQECRYEKVAPGTGDYAPRDPPRKGGNSALVCGFVVAAAVVGALVFIMQSAATTTTMAFHHAPSKEHLPGDDYDCEIQALLAGERVQAAEDIRFNPAGSVPTGVYGTVQEDADYDDGKGVVVVSFDKHPELKKAEVTRDLIVKVIEEGDTVSAVTDVRYTPTGDIHEAPLGIADMVRAAVDMGKITKGTYGHLISKEPGDFVLVKFAGDLQVSAVKVAQDHVLKAPQVGDHVESAEPIHCADQAINIPSGSYGSIVSMEPVGDPHRPSSYYFKYVVDWYKLTSTCKGVLPRDLKVIAGPVGRGTIPQSTLGKVTQRLKIDGSAQYDYVVAWNDFPGSSGRVSRGDIVKVSQWDAKQMQWCCRHKGVGCTTPPPEKDKASDVSKPSTTQRDLFDCFLDGADGEWPQDQAKWCCDVKGFGCAHTSTQAPEAPLYRCEGATSQEMEEWPVEKAKWCCSKEGQGCHLANRNGMFRLQG